jgi:hypothetical protein
VDWQGRDGPPLAPPGGAHAAIAAIASIRAAFPGTTAWWGHQTGTWQAAVPRGAGVSLVSSASPAGLWRELAGTHPRLASPAGSAAQHHGPQAGAAGTAGETPYLPAAPHQTAGHLAHPTADTQGRPPQ